MNARFASVFAKLNLFFALNPGFPSEFMLNPFDKSSGQVYFSKGMTKTAFFRGSLILKLKFLSYPKAT